VYLSFEIWFSQKINYGNQKCIVDRQGEAILQL